MKDLNTEQIKASVAELYEARQEKKEFENYYNAVNKKESISISNFIYCNIKDDTSFNIVLDSGKNYYANKKKLKVTRITQKKITWNCVKLKKQMNPETYKKIVKKEYTINNMPKFIEFLKSYNVDPKKFKTFIDVDESVDTKLLEQLYDTGKIKRSEINNCYEVKVGEPFIKITEM